VWGLRASGDPSVSRGLGSKTLGREALAAAGATGVDDVPATDRRHPRAEAVPPLANQLARLISTFHGNSPIEKRCSYRGVADPESTEGVGRAARLIVPAFALPPAGLAGYVRPAAGCDKKR